MRLDVENLTDFLQYYGENYLRGRDSCVYYCTRERAGIDKLFFLKSVGARWVKTEINWSLFQETFFFGLPRTGCMALGKELVYFYCDPVRRGSRGLDSSRLLYHSFNRDELRVYNQSHFDLHKLENNRGQANPRLLQQILFPIRLSLEEVMEKFNRQNKPWISAAIDKDFGAFQSVYYERPVLTYRFTRLGTIEGKNLKPFNGALNKGLLKLISIKFGTNFVLL